MKRILFFPFLFALLLLYNPATASTTDSIPVAIFVSNFQADLDLVKSKYQSQRKHLTRQLRKINNALTKSVQSNADLDVEDQLNLLLRKISIQENLSLLDQTFEIDLTKKRYKKGIELIKMLYEKLLALDHHFSSLNTFQNVNSLSNPNSYPEFQKTRELLEGRLKKDNNIKVPSLLSANPYISTTFSLVASLIGGGNSKDRESDLDDISCILDFTASMNAELATIFYETEFLKESNSALKDECLVLFLEYTKVVGYFTTLDKCRKEDDWEKLYESLDVFTARMAEDLAADGNSPGSKVYKDQINLEFSVDRLLEFITKYNSFISQGEKYYKKFKIIVSNYPNEAKCLDKLPPQFTQLQSDIDNSIYKFNEAYDVSELTGSKLKDLLYGFDD